MTSFDKQYVKVRLPGSLVLQAGEELLVEWAVQAGGSITKVDGCDGCECGGCCGRDGDTAWGGYVTAPPNMWVDGEDLEAHVAGLLGMWLDEQKVAV